MFEVIVLHIDYPTQPLPWILNVYDVIQIVNTNEDATQKLPIASFPIDYNHRRRYQKNLKDLFQKNMGA